MHFGPLCMQLRLPVSFFSSGKAKNWVFFSKDRTYRAFLHNKRFFCDSPGGFALLLGQCAALRSLAQLTTPFLASGNAPKWVFFPKDRGAFPEAKKGVVNCARLRTGPLIMQIPRGYQKKTFIV